MSIRLSNQTLASLPAAVAAPAYDRAALSPGIVHFGVGNFHRAHMAVYLDALFGLGGDKDWAIIGAGLRPADAQMRERLAGQDWLTTVVEQDSERTTAHVTGSMIGFIASDDRAGLLARLCDPATRIVSLTITEGGYFIDPASGTFNPEHPEIVREAKNPDDPQTIFGLIVAALAKRRAAGVAPFTIMSCDNIPGNGHVTRNVVAGLAHLIDPELGDFVRDHVACPNGMVDRITPATSPRDAERLLGTYGIVDAAPIYCEGFKQWVLEDHFPTGRPALEKVGVTFVSDVAPYEMMKIRILNGGHAAVAYPAALLDIGFMHEAMREPLLAAFLAKLGTEEIIPLVPPVPDTDLEDYLAVVAERFANPNIADTVARVCFDGSNRQPKYVLPTVQDGLDQEKKIQGLALVSAQWARYCHGTTDSGATIAPNDPDWDRLKAAAERARTEPASFLELRDIFGEIGRHPRYVEAFSAALASLWSRGTRSTLERYLAGEAL